MISSYSLIDYGIEAAWTAWYEDARKIPHRLVQYALVQACYNALVKGSGIVQWDYPESLKSYPYFLVAIEVMGPLFVKRLIALGLEGLVDYFVTDEQEESQDELSDAALVAQ